MTSNEQLTFILFGATGDLAGRKIFPALYELYRTQVISKDITIIGNSRTDRSDSSFRDLVYQYLIKYYGEIDLPTWHHLEKRIFFVPGNASDKQTTNAIQQKITALQTQGLAAKNYMYYIATLPDLYPYILRHLGQMLKKTPAKGWFRILIEKPFGTDLSSAQKLNGIIRQYFREEEIYRMDHFLAKETVQNILAFRFANGLFEPIWNRKFIDNIQISSLETNGIEGREIFYDNTGTLRDVVQNHVLELLSVTLMDMPTSLEPQAIRQRRLEVLEKLKKISPSPQSIIYGQYSFGALNGAAKRAYIQEENIPTDSPTETFVALKTYLNSKRWRGVPIYVRAGKRMAKTVTEISIRFKDPKDTLVQFQKHMSPNILTIRIQPDESIILRFDAKKPGFGYQLQPVTMQFCYQDIFGKAPLIEAYQRLLADALAGDHSLFPTASGVEVAWDFITPLLQDRNNPHPVEIYPAGSWGPQKAEEIFTQDNHIWLEPSVNVC